jgi:hypothetical protein
MLPNIKNVLEHQYILTKHHKIHRVTSYFYSRKKYMIDHTCMQNKKVKHKIINLRKERKIKRMK